MGFGCLSGWEPIRVGEWDWCSRDEGGDVVDVEEFVAHVGDVNCLKIGRSNPSLIATGGEDRKVNIWEVGQMKVLTVSECVCSAQCYGCRDYVLLCSCMKVDLKCVCVCVCVHYNTRV